MAVLLDPDGAKAALGADASVACRHFGRAVFDRHVSGHQPAVAETLGGRLLVSGFWGFGRKINYTGEIGVYISFAACAGLSSPYPYLLPLSLLVLLTQRAARDDKKCRAKYGELWEAYCKRARFRIIPFIY